MTEKMGLEVQLRKGYIYASVFGVFSLAQAIELYKKILKDCSQNDCTKILIDTRMLNRSPTATDRFVAGNLIPILQNKQAYKVAFWGSAQMTRPDKPVEKTAVVAGAKVKVTVDLGEALGWLGVEGT
jgi:hypothetical protein